MEKQCEKQCEQMRYFVGKVLQIKTDTRLTHWVERDTHAWLMELQNEIRTYLAEQAKLTDSDFD